MVWFNDYGVRSGPVVLALSRLYGSNSASNIGLVMLIGGEKYPPTSENNNESNTKRCQLAPAPSFLKD